MPTITLNLPPGFPVVLKGDPNEPVAATVEATLKIPDPLSVGAKIEGGDPKHPVAVNVGATIEGGQNPLAALVSSPPGEAIAAKVGATIDGGANPLNVALTGTVTAPVRLDLALADVGLRNTTIKFKLFGFDWLTILTIEVRS